MSPPGATTWSPVTSGFFRSSIEKEIWLPATFTEPDRAPPGAALHAHRAGQRVTRQHAVQVAARQAAARGVTLPVTLSPLCVRLATTGTAEQPGTPEWNVPVQVPVTFTAAVTPLPGEVTMLEESLHAEAAIRPAARAPASGSERFVLRRDGMDDSFESPESLRPGIGDFSALCRHLGSF